MTLRSKAEEMRALGVTRASWDHATGEVTSIELGDLPSQPVEPDEYDDDAPPRQPRTRARLVEERSGSRA